MLRAQTTTVRVLSLGLLASGLVMISNGFAGNEGPRRSSTGAPVQPRGKMGQDLFLAIDHRDTATVQALLDKGADPNSQNGLEMTPLHIAAASYQPDVVQALLKAGAKVDFETVYGTPLAFAAMSGNAMGAETLLQKGAKVNTKRSDSTTVLMMAANSGSPEIIAELLKRKANVNAKNDAGSTALSFAARNGNVAAGDLLLKGGAIVETADEEGMTPLMYAAMRGQNEFVNLLIKKGAKVNARNAEGQTPLMLAAAYGDSPEVVKSLLKAGADQKARDKRGRSAAAFAKVRGYKNSAALLNKPTSAEIAAVKVPANTRAAVTNSLKSLESSMTKFTQRATCISCHHEGLGRIVTASASARGFSTDKSLAKVQAARVGGMASGLKPLHEMAVKSDEAMKQLPLIEMNEVTAGYTWLMAGMGAQKEPADAARAAMAAVLAKQQSPDGFWSFSLPRVPMQSSFFTFTALSVQALNNYGSKASKDEIAERIGRAKNWMLSAPAKNIDDQAFRVLGLNWSKATTDQMQTAIAELKKSQQADGGWSQNPGLASDAYATGLALYALHNGGGMSVTDPVYKRGIQYLLRTQDADGTWFVTKRALPANNYLNAGYPHAEAQYSSFNGACWATLALLDTLPKK